jgi:hypothetical protein
MSIDLEYTVKFPDAPMLTEQEYQSVRDAYVTYVLQEECCKGERIGSSYTFLSMLGFQLAQKAKNNK